MWQNTPWRAQKVAARQDPLPLYSYFVAPGYVQIPATDYELGFRTPDRANENVFAHADSFAPNTPWNAQGLYKPHDDLAGGIRAYTDVEAAIDYAPFLVHRPIFAAVQLRDRMMLNHRPIGCDLSNGEARGSYIDYVPDEGINYRAYVPLKQQSATGEVAKYLRPKFS